jgi:hypothetical protein
MLFRDCGLGESLTLDTEARVGGESIAEELRLEEHKPFKACVLSKSCI